MEKIKIGISRCLLGEKVRYDGQYVEDPYITEILARYVDFIPVCPEVEYGLTVPREPMRLVGDPDGPRLITVHTGIDHTEGLAAWARRKLDGLLGAGLCGFIFKTRSPSCGVYDAKVYAGTSVSDQPVAKGVGIFAEAFMKRFPLIPVEDEERLGNPEVREDFVERVFACQRQIEVMLRNHA